MSHCGLGHDDPNQGVGRSTRRRRSDRRQLRYRFRGRRPFRGGRGRPGQWAERPIDNGGQRPLNVVAEPRMAPGEQHAICAPKPLGKVLRLGESTRPAASPGSAPTACQAGRPSGTGGAGRRVVREESGADAMSRLPRSRGPRAPLRQGTRRLDPGHRLDCNDAVLTADPSRFARSGCTPRLIRTERSPALPGPCIQALGP